LRPGPSRAGPQCSCRWCETSPEQGRSASSGRPGITAQGENRCSYRRLVHCLTWVRTRTGVGRKGKSGLFVHVPIRQGDKLLRARSSLNARIEPPFASVAGTPHLQKKGSE
jgi:hypothetical protein